VAWPLTLNAKLKSEQTLLQPRASRFQPYNTRVARNRPNQHLGGFATLVGAGMRKIFIRLKHVADQWPVAVVAIGVLLTLAWIGLLVWAFLILLA
jgi:hypothetical protein